MKEKLFFALDVRGYASALKLAHALRNSVGGFKLGLEQFVSRGPRGAYEISTYGPVLLDLKLHDIPATVARTVKVVRDLPVEYLTVHVGDDGESVRAAVDAADGTVKVVGVTVLTSVEDAADVPRRVALAEEAGAWGVVCSGHEVAAIKAVCPHLHTVTPGIRFSGGEVADQKRVVTPSEAVQAGADIVVVGRAIRDAVDPRLAAEDCVRQMEKVTAPEVGEA